MMEQEKDPRFRKLSTLGAVLNFIAAIIALVAVVSNQWATLNEESSFNVDEQALGYNVSAGNTSSGPIFGYMGPIMICQSVHGGSDRCERGGLGPYRQTWASYVAAAAAVLTAIVLSGGAVLGFMVVSMHHAKHEICVKFRHATFARMVTSSGAAFLALISFVCFLLEAKVFLRMQSSHRTRLSWGFYLEILAFFMASAVGMIASVEWRWARKLGGDPTVYTRDPDGTKADTIANPNFREAPGTRPTPSQQKGGNRSGNQQRGGGVIRNTNGIAMTATSGQPYMLSTNGRTQNGSLPNGKPPVVAFDPRRIPGRSSLRRPKQQVSAEDQMDSSDLTVPNPNFTTSSPTPKKKVRIYTQSTAV